METDVAILDVNVEVAMTRKNPQQSCIRVYDNFQTIKSSLSWDNLEITTPDKIVLGCPELLGCSLCLVDVF